MGFRIYNTVTREVEIFKPLKEGKVGLYCCGPTVYNFAHIGNLRSYVFEDILRRILERNHYKVNHVMNITDVGHLTDDGDDGEDKMIKAAREQGMDVWQIAEHFTQAFFEDSEKLHIKRPSQVCKATEHIKDMQELVKRLQDNNLTYQAGGNVYFNTGEFPGYGKMANLDKQDQRQTERIDIDQAKKHPRDFVLWFTQSKFDNQAMQWDSQWGRGYPGWHLECSAMSMKYLGESFDIHCGGVDHIPVHHTNEIAQSEGATGKKWVNYWVHGEFLITKQGKMAKSKGEFLTLSRLIEKGYDPLDYRYFLLGAHYRSQLIFTYESLDSAKKARNNLKDKIILYKKDCGDNPGNISEAGHKFITHFNSAINNDMNMPQALSVVWAVVKSPELDSAEKLAVLYDLDQVLGLGMENWEEEVVELDAEIENLIQQRIEARKNKDYAKSDEIRDLLLSRGIQLLDGSEGTTWKKL